MKLKNTAFTNNVSVWTPSINDYRSNPDWGMEVGQSEKHTFTEDGIEEILTAMVYYKIQDESEVMVGLGKGKKFLHYSDYDDKEFVLTSLFPKVYLDGKRLKGQKLLLYIIKDLRQKNSKGEKNPHFERRQLKFSKNLTYQGQEVNRNCIEAISDVYGQDSSWAILKMEILNEDELHLYGIKVGDGERKYKNKDERNEEFEKLWKIQHPSESLNTEDRNVKKTIKKNIGYAQKEDLFETESSIRPSQIIFYGVPGCGKSETIKERLENVPEYNKVRIVFHPEYTNAEFVGSIQPCIENKKVSYKFSPGPFSRILRRAYLNPDRHFYLIIEELNRGRADAIFGETFQLFDRIKKDKDEFGYHAKWSTFPVENMDVSEYIRDKELLIEEQKNGLCGNVVDSELYENEKDGAGDSLTKNATSYESLTINREDVENETLVFSDTTPIRFPPNLSILGTMNTSDQNIFILDNAFQRRIDLKLVRNEFESGDVDGYKTKEIKDQHDAKIAETDVSWGKFWGWINAKITATLKGLSSTEDKRLGVWFVSNVNGVIEDKIFAEKVLKFLWDDVFKFKRPQVFADGVDTLEKLIKFFENPPKGKDRFDVFKDKADLVAFVASPTL